jgi:Flp pilus assembly protein TadG
MSMIESANHRSLAAMRAVGRELRRFLGKHGIAGLAAIEFAVIAPLLVLMMVSTVDLGLGFYSAMQVQNAAQAGAQYAALHTFNATSISSAVLNATSFKGISASPSPIQFCGCPSKTTVATATCGTKCADGTAAATYVRVSAKGTYTTLLPYPRIPSSFPLAAHSTVRTQ